VSAGVGKTNLDHTVRDARVEARLRSCRRTVDNCPRAEEELACVPRALDAGLLAVAHEPSLGQWTREVTAQVRENVDVIAPPDDDKSLPSNADGGRFVLDERLERCQVLPASGEKMRDVFDMVGARSLPITEMTSDEPGRCDDTQPEKTEQFAVPRSVRASAEKRRQVETGGDHVGRRVHEAHSLLLLMQFRPVGETSHGGGPRTEQPRPDEDSGRCSHPRNDIQEGR
jgi:hypothetical protein